MYIWYMNILLIADTIMITIDMYKQFNYIVNWYLTTYEYAE